MLENGMKIAGRYEITAKIGTGGMSDVYKATDCNLGRPVAIKVLKEEFSQDAGFVEKFRGEAQAAASLEHPNIVNVYDVGAQDGFHYIIMEYVSGITLKHYIEKKGQLNYKEVLSIAIQVARGLQSAHANNIIHRDIKPQNIMISTDGKVKVTDFGIARAVSEHTIHSDVMGSVHYSSPEQTRNGYITNRSDIYSLGIVMYEMVTGRVPFDGDSTVAVAIKHLQEEMVVPSTYAKNLPISLEKIILKCTQKTTNHRYESMDALLIDLRKSLLNPDEDFVVLAPVDQGKTRVLTEDEIKLIQYNAAAKKDGEPQSDGEKKAQEDAIDKSGKKYAYIYDDDEDEDEEEDDAEEEKGGFLNPKLEKLVVALCVVIGIIIVLILVYVFGNMNGWINFNLGGSKEAVEDTADYIEVPDLVGKTMEEAEALVDGTGLTVVISSEEVSEEYEPGQIISQDVEAGEMVADGTTIYVVLCVEEEPEEVTVPDVVGYISTSAMTVLQDKGFEVNREFEYSSTVSAGEVIRQDPEAGTTAYAGTTVTIYVSQGSETTAVPSLEGKTKSEAETALGDAGLNVGTVTEAYSDTVAAGCVISQSISSGTYVDMGTSVNFVVSLGEEETSYYVRLKVKALEGDNITVQYCNIYLYYAESDELITSWTNVTEFPYIAEIHGITDYNKGYYEIVWYYTDAEGNTQTYHQESDGDITFSEE